VSQPRSSQSGAADDETYSWAGVDEHGVAHAGRTGRTIDEIARATEHYYRQGWQSLRVARGWDLPDDPESDLVAQIGPDHGGGRTWWSEASGPAERPAPERRPGLEAGQ
jgi:hypothetical protein